MFSCTVINIFIKLLLFVIGIKLATYEQMVDHNLKQGVHVPLKYGWGGGHTEW